MEKKNKRLKLVIEFLEARPDANIAEIIKNLEAALGRKIPKITVNRDLAELLEQKIIKRTGKGPAVRYRLSPGRNFLKDIDVQEYFKDDSLNRPAAKSFNFDIFNVLEETEIFSRAEMELLSGLNKKFQSNIKKLPDNIIKREYERLTIELSWKSSHFEGNTYNLLETERLIKDQVEARGHTKEEAVMILNHKEAIDYINRNKKDYKEISAKKIEDIHYLLTKDLGISRNIRKNLVGITGTAYRPLDNEHQIKEAINSTCELVNKNKNAFVKALLLNILLAYIQPFEDGNKRTSRLMGNAALAAHDSCPLSFRGVDELEYKKAMILFYEQNNISYFKDLFIAQYKFSVENYFLA